MDERKVEQLSRHFNSNSRFCFALILGGQRIFQSFQHLLVVRRAVYLVVFNMQSFLDAPQKSFSFLDFWLHTIIIHAEGAPVFLIGTRGDMVKSDDDKTKVSRMREISIV